MTGFKQLLSYQGQPLILRLVHQLQSLNIDKIICVTGKLEKEIKDILPHDGIIFAHNERYENGMLSSLQCGLEILQNNDFEAVLVCLTDQPLIATDHYSHLIKESQSEDFSIVSSAFNETFGPPVVFKACHFKEILKAKGKSAKHIIKNNVSNLKTVFCAEAGIDIDTDEDYHTLLKEHE